MRAGTKRRRVVKPAEERRRELLEAAARVFARVGVHDATVSDIAREAGVAKGTFYLSFPSRDRLLGELKSRFADEIVERAAALVERAGRDDWWSVVDTTIESMVGFMLDRRGLIQVFAQEASTAETMEVFGGCVSKLIGLFAEGIRRGVGAGAFEAPDPELTAALLHHAVDGTLKHQILYEGEVDRKRLVAAARRLARKTLAP